MSVSDTQTFVDALAEVFERTENPERITAVLVRELARELGLTAASLLAIEPVAGDTFQLRTLATYSRREVDSLPPAAFDRQVEIPADSALHGIALITEIPSGLIAAGESYDVALPLTVRQSARAVLLVRYGPTGRRLTSEAWRAIRPLVLTAVIANRAFSRFRRYETQLERRLRVAPDFRFDQNADELFVRARKIFGPGRMFVLQLDPEDQALALLAANWPLARTTPGVGIPLEGGVLGESVAERQPSLITAMPSGDVQVGQRVTRPLPAEAELLLLGTVLLVPIRNGEELVGAFGLERVASTESELKASAEAATFFAALGRILAYSRVHESLLLDNGRVELVNRAAKKLREGEFQIESRLYDRATALETLSADGLPDKSLALLARELRFGIDTLVKTFSQLVGFVDALYQVGHAGLEIGETLEAYLTKVVLLLRDRLGYERVILLLADAKQGVLQNPVVSFQYEGPEEEREIGGLKLDYFNAKRSVWAWVARNQRELYVPDAHADYVEDEQTGERVYINRRLVELFKGNSFLAVPLIARHQSEGESQLLGILSVASLHADRIRKSDLNVLRAIARQISLTIENVGLREHLKQQIEDRDRELQKQRQELRESYFRLFRYERNEFHLDLTAGLAHDLKNPLVAGRQYLQVLQIELDAFIKVSQPLFESDQAPLDEFRATAHKYVAKVSEVLSKVQERLRDIELRAIETEPAANEQLCDVLAALEESLADIPQAMRSGIEMHVDLSPIAAIRSHPDSLRSLFMNLITNAIEAIPKDRGGDIWLTLRPDGSHIVFTVEDNGRGIAAPDLEKVFHARFTTKPRGTGLGLAWVYRNVTQHLNGSIQVESGDLGRGKRTRFTVRLPAAVNGS